MVAHMLAQVQVLEILGMAQAQVVWANLYMLLVLALALALVLDLVAMVQQDESTIINTM